jgi:hypothetical protein
LTFYTEWRARGFLEDTKETWEIKGQKPKQRRHSKPHGKPDAWRIEIGMYYSVPPPPPPPYYSLFFTPIIHYFLKYVFIFNFNYIF